MSLPDNDTLEMLRYGSAYNAYVRARRQYTRLIGAAEGRHAMYMAKAEDCAGKGDMVMAEHAVAKAQTYVKAQKMLREKLNRAEALARRIGAGEKSIKISATEAPEWGTAIGGNA